MQITISNIPYVLELNGYCSFFNCFGIFKDTAQPPTNGALGMVELRWAKFKVLREQEWGLAQFRQFHVVADPATSPERVFHPLYLQG